MAITASSATNASFDPFTQSFTLLMPDGVTPFVVPLPLLQLFVSIAVKQAVIQSIQFGLAVMLMLVMVLMTRSEKRRSLIFFVNTSALLFVALRSIFSIVTFNGPYFTFYRWSSGLYFDLGNAPTISVVGEIFTIFLTFSIELALILQVHIVCCTLSSFQRLVINFVNIFVATVACTCHLALAVMNINWNMLHTAEETPYQFKTINNMAEATYIAITVSVGLSSLIFTVKLAHAIRRRRSMGMKQFGPMQIIFVMGCQTMLVPFIFTIISYFAVPDVQIQSFVQTAVAVLLPLSGIWASTSTTNVNIAEPGYRSDRTLLPGSDGYGDSDKSKKYSSTLCDSVHTCSTLVGQNSDKSDSAADTKKLSVRVSQDPIDLEMLSITSDRVQLDRTLSMASGHLFRGSEASTRDEQV